MRQARHNETVQNFQVQYQQVQDGAGWCRMVQDGAGESLRSLCILCASRYDSDKAVTRSRSCMLNPVDPNAVENTTCTASK